MGRLSKLMKEIFSSRNYVEKQGEKDRYSPGKMESYFPRSMRQPAKMFKKAFGNHRDDDE